MNYHKLKDVINMKFMGQSEVRHQLLEYVEKQEPKKAIPLPNSKFGYACPTCNKLVLANKYCGFCGQRVWYD